MPASICRRARRFTALSSREPSFRNGVTSAVPTPVNGMRMSRSFQADYAARFHLYEPASRADLKIRLYAFPGDCFQADLEGPLRPAPFRMRPATAGPLTGYQASGFGLRTSVGRLLITVA